MLAAWVSVGIRVWAQRECACVYSHRDLHRYPHIMRVAAAKSQRAMANAHQERANAPSRLVNVIRNANKGLALL